MDHGVSEKEIDEASKFIKAVKMAEDEEEATKPTVKDGMIPRAQQANAAQYVSTAMALISTLVLSA